MTPSTAGRLPLWCKPHESLAIKPRTDWECSCTREHSPSRYGPAKKLLSIR